MAEDQIQKALLAKGYFPKELPDVFTTEDFGEHSKAIIQDWLNDKVFEKDEKSLGKLPGRKIRRSSFTFKLKHAEPEIISKPKRGYERRNIHITHPIPQGLLASELAKNWRSVQKWLSRGIFSEDELRVSLEYERSIKGINFSTHRAKKAYLEATSDWLVKTDITRFYPSIYTHSLSWAAYGKEKTKKALNLYKGSLADRLDLLVRSCNRNQTIGIPIGPETSRVIAEIISSRIDEEFRKRCERIPTNSIDRLQDDWVVGVKSLEQAENVLSHISAVYRDYGLEINGSKTSIEHIIASNNTTWISEIGSFLSHKSGTLAGVRLREFLLLALRLQTDFPSEPVINYSLAVVERILPSRAETETLESFLLKAAVISPASMDRICRIIINLDFRTKAISKRRISSRFTEIAERSIVNGNLYEVLWLLYTMRGLKVPLSSKIICDAVETTASSAISLLLLDMKSKGLCVYRLPNNEWENQITEDRIYADWIWLLAYEGIRHGWLRDTQGVMSDPFFAAMSSRNVVFYDPKRNISRSEKVIRTEKSVRKQQLSERNRFIEKMRMVISDLEWSEY